MKCKGCGEEYNQELFPVCPYCLRSNEENTLLDGIKEQGTDIDDKLKNISKLEESVEQFDNNITEQKKLIDELKKELAEEKDRQNTIKNSIFTMEREIEKYNREANEKKKSLESSYLFAQKNVASVTEQLESLKNELLNLKIFSFGKKKSLKVEISKTEQLVFEANKELADKKNELNHFMSTTPSDCFCEITSKLEISRAQENEKEEKILNLEKRILYEENILEKMNNLKAEAEERARQEEEARLKAEAEERARQEETNLNEEATYIDGINSKTKELQCQFEDKKSDYIDEALYSIDDISFLSNRAKNAMKRNGVFTLGQLKEFGENNDFNMLRMVGTNTIEELHMAMNYNPNEDTVQLNSQAMEHNDTNAKIKDIYSENKYHIFVTYCDIAGFESMDDLRGFDFNELNGVQGLGAGKIRDIVSKYQEYEHEIDDDSDKVFEGIHPELKQLDISFLLGFDIRERLIKLLREDGYKKIGDLENITYNHLISIVSKRNIDKFQSVNELLRVSLKKIFEKILDDFSVEADYQYTLKKAEGYTLQEIGDLAGLTRERVRQIIKKFTKKLDSFMVNICAEYFKNKGYISVQDLVDIYDNDDYDKIVVYWCKEYDKYEYLDFAEIFVEKEDESIEAKLLALAEDYIGEGKDIGSDLSELESIMSENGYPYVDKDIFLSLLQKYGYVMYGTYIVKGHKSYGFLCAKIVAEKFPNGIKLYDGPELDLLRKYAFEKYGDIGIATDNRSLSTRLADYTVLCGRGMVTAEENIYVDSNLLEEIKEYIDDSSKREIYYAELFSKYEGMIRMMSNIDNYHFLHGVLKLYYSDEYDFSSRDYLMKKGEGLSSGKFSSRLNEYIVENGGAIQRSEIKRKFPGITDAVLLNTVYYDEKLLQWEYNCYTSLECISITDTEKDILCDVIDKITKENYGYCNDALLYDGVKDTMTDFLIRNKIKTTNNLYFLCAKLFAEKYNFKRPHITVDGMIEDISVRNVALHFLGYPDKLYYTKYQQVAEKLKWSTGTICSVFYNIAEDYIRVSSDLYIKKNKFEINDEDIIGIEKVIRNHMKVGYVSLMNFDFYEELPEIQYEWNEHLLRAIVDEYVDKLRVIDTKMKDRRFERGIIVDDESEIKDYADVVISFMQANEMCDVSESTMLSVLVVNNLAYKLIPKDLYTSEKIKYKNERFIII